MCRQTICQVYESVDTKHVQAGIPQKSAGGTNYTSTIPTIMSILYFKSSDLPTAYRPCWNNWFSGNCNPYQTRKKGYISSWQKKYRGLCRAKIRKLINSFPRFAYMHQKQDYCEKKRRWSTCWKKWRVSANMRKQSTWHENASVSVLYQHMVPTLCATVRQLSDYKLIQITCSNNSNNLFIN